MEAWSAQASPPHCALSFSPFVCTLQVRDVLRAGVDLDCSGELLRSHAEAALREGVISQDDIDGALRNSLRVRMRLAHFDPDYARSPLHRIDPATTLCSDEGRALARDGAAQAVVLLKNDVLPASATAEIDLGLLDSFSSSSSSRRLPLPAGRGRGNGGNGGNGGFGLGGIGLGGGGGGSAASIAVIGPNANLSMTIAGYYGPANACDGPNGRWPTIVDAVANHAGGAVTTARGVPSCAANATEAIASGMIDEAVALARAADTVVLALGTDLDWAREGADATSLELSSGQFELLERVAAAAAEPLVVVVMTATPLDLTRLLAHPRVGAIVHAGFPSAQVEP